LFGGSLPPKVNFEFELKRVDEGVRGLVVNDAGVLLPDVVENVVTGEWGNVAVMNVASLDDSNGNNWLEVVSIMFEMLDDREAVSVCTSFGPLSFLFF
jgi:hypothetical protein